MMLSILLASREETNHTFIITDQQMEQHPLIQGQPSHLESDLSDSHSMSSIISEQLRVNWVTASELDSDTFEIQRDADGILFESHCRYSSRWLLYGLPDNL